MVGLIRFHYDNILKRLVVNNEESFYGLQNGSIAASFDQDPPIFACRFSEAPGYEHILALANEDGKVAIQDTSNVTRASTLEGFQCHNNAVFDLAWMPHHTNFVTVSGDHTACLWQLAAGGVRRSLVLSHHTRSVKTAAFGSAALLASGARDGHVLLWDVRAGAAPQLQLRPASRLLGCHAASPAAARPRRPPRAASVTGLVFQDEVTLLSCGECDGGIKAWDLRKTYGAHRREPLPKRSIPYCGSSTRNGYTNLVVDEGRVRLYASCMDGVIYCFNVSTYNPLPERRYVGHESGTFYIKTCLSPDGAYLVSGSSDKNAYVWNVKCSEPVVKLTGHRAEVTCAAWCQRGDAKIVTCSDDARHKIWRIGSEFPAGDAAVQGRAELVPRTELANLPQWGASDKTPTSLKRRTVSTPGSYGAKRLRTQNGASARKTKRCLTDLMNASRDADEAERSIKRLKLDNEDEPKSLPTGIKRHGDSLDGTSKRCNIESLNDWCYIPKAGSSFMTPTKNYESKNCKILSPRGLKSLSPNTIHDRSPVRVSPSKVRIISFTTPTKNLPNFVLDGEAPHLRLMSPVRKKDNPTDWLTLMVREKKGKSLDFGEKNSLATPLSPKENVPTRRNSVTERTPRCNNKNRTLLKYFSVIVKEKQ